MTEAEWLASSSPGAMLAHLRGRAIDRKLRLFAVACCRRFWELLPDGRIREAVEAAERFADGEIDAAALGDTHAAAEQAVASPYDPKNVAGGAVLCAAAPNVDSPFMQRAVRAVADHAGPHPDEVRAKRIKQECAASSDRLREVFGNPFRPVTIDPAVLTWREGTIPKLAQSVYDERELPSGHLDHHSLAVLADALEDAGCTSPAILDHCRSEGPHVRGCWVIDMLLGKQ
jgi:hypothetical protein